MDVSCSPDSLISYSHFPCHVPPAHVLVCSRSCFTCFSYLYQYGLSTRPRLLVCFPFLLLSRRLVYAYLYRLCLSLCSLSTRLPSRYFWTLTHYGVISLSCIFVLVSRILLYIWVGDVGLFPIFNLLCNHPKVVTCEIPCTLLVRSSLLVKATASRFLGVISSVYSLTGSEVQPTQCTSVRS